jgi:hypothetical protein
VCSSDLGQNQSLFYGEYHNYSVTFKEDGEAIIYAKLVFTNSGNEDITSYSFNAKDSELKELAILQVKLPQECADYTQVYDPITGRNKCARFRDPDYNSYYYYSYGSTEEITYRNAKFSNEGLSYTVELPEALKPDKTSALLLAYTSTDYTKTSFSAKSYNFPTLTIGNRITEAKIGVSVDEGLVLEGVTTPTYCTMGMCPISATKDVAVSSIGDASGISSTPVTNRSLDNLYASIGTGQKVFEAKSIAPDKSFEAKGKYAKTKLGLNSQSLILSIVGVLIFIAIVVLVSLRLRNKSIKSQSAKNGKWTGINLMGKMVPVASLIPMAGLISGTWYLSTDNFSSNVWNAVNGAGKSFVVVFVVLLYAVLVSIMPIIFGLKNGWHAIVSVIIMQALWGTLLLAIILPFMIFSN